MSVFLVVVCFVSQNLSVGDKYCLFSSWICELMQVHWRGGRMSITATCLSSHLWWMKSTSGSSGSFPHVFKIVDFQATNSSFWASLIFFPRSCSTGTLVMLTQMKYRWRSFGVIAYDDFREVNTGPLWAKKLCTIVTIAGSCVVHELGVSLNACHGFT
jgi:hypothetical protein